MTIHLEGKAEKLLEFVKGMQFPITSGFASTEGVEAEKEKRKEEYPWENELCDVGVVTYLQPSLHHALNKIANDENTTVSGLVAHFVRKYAEENLV